MVSAWELFEELECEDVVAVLLEEEVDIVKSVGVRVQVEFVYGLFLASLLYAPLRVGLCRFVCLCVIAVLIK